MDHWMSFPDVWNAMQEYHAKSREAKAQNSGPKCAVEENGSRQGDGGTEMCIPEGWGGVTELDF